MSAMNHMYCELVWTRVQNKPGGSAILSELTSLTSHFSGCKINALRRQKQLNDEYTAN